MKNSLLKKVAAGIISTAMLGMSVPAAAFTSTAADSDTIFSTSFENGEGADSFSRRGTAENIEATTDYAHTGDYSLCASNRTASWNGPQFRLDDGTCSPNTEYLVSAWVMGQYYTDVTISMQYTAAGADSPTYSNLAKVSGNGWFEFSDIKISFTSDVTDVYIYFEGGGTDNIYVDDFTIEAAPIIPIQNDLVSISDAYSQYFKIGTAIMASNLSSQSFMNLVEKHFDDSITFGNELKPDSVLNKSASQAMAADGDDTNPQVSLNAARSLLNYCRDTNTPVRGHTLVWHSQTPDWFFKENFADDGEWVSKEKMIQRMENYIKNVMEALATEYPTVEFYAWDVVNEAWTDSGTPRTAGSNNTSSGQSAWVQVFGDNSFIEYAFTFARKYAPEGCKLYYNDYNEYMSAKTNAIVEMATDLKEKGLIDGIGMQSHLDARSGSDAFPSVSAYEKAVAAFAATGLDVQVTELDVTIPGSSDSNYEVQAQYYSDIMDVCVKYADSISAVVFWGVTDDQSWRASQYPLLFDAEFQAKPAYYSIVDGLDVPDENSITVEVYDIDTGELVPGIKMAFCSIDTTPGVDASTYMSWNTSDENPKTFTGLSSSPIAYEVYIEDAESAGYHEAVDTAYAIEFTENMDTNSVTFRIPVQKYETDVIYGDANDNGTVEIADAVYILQGIADPSNEDYALTAQGEKNADCHNVGNGVDAEDALAIQQFKADIVTALPVNS